MFVWLCIDFTCIRRVEDERLKDNQFQIIIILRYIITVYFLSNPRIVRAVPKNPKEPPSTVNRPLKNI